MHGYAYSHAQASTPVYAGAGIKALDIAVCMQLVSIIIVATGNLHNSTVTNLLQLLR